MAFFNDPEDDDIDNDLNDPDFQFDEDFHNPVEVMELTPEDMEKPNFLQVCILARIRGNLPELLYAFGITGEEAVAKVNQILDQNFPSFDHQTEVLFELIENELSQMCLGGACKVIDMQDGLTESEANIDRRLKALQLLYKVRSSRTVIKAKLEAQ